MVLAYWLLSVRLRSMSRQGDSCLGFSRAGALRAWLACLGWAMVSALLGFGCSGNATDEESSSPRGRSQKQAAADSEVAMDGLDLADGCRGAGREYVGDPLSCQDAEVTCEEGWAEFSDECGCGCYRQPDSCQSADREYVLLGPGACEGLAPVECDEGLIWFDDECGCGCGGER